MKTEELILRINDECHTGSPEDDHVHAENLLLEFIDDPFVTSSFKAVHRWYA